MRAVCQALALALVFTLVAPAISDAGNDAAGQSPKTLILTDEQGEYPLGLYLEMLEDPSGKLTIKDVSSPKFRDRFTPSKVKVPNFGFTRSVYWVRFPVRNQAKHTRQWLLEQGFANMQRITVFAPNPNKTGFEMKQAGALLPFRMRDIDNATCVFKIILEPDITETIYLRFESGTSMSLPLTLWSPEKFSTVSRNRACVVGLLSGCALIMIGYNLFLLYSLRENSYLYYVLTIAFMILLIAAFRGFGNQLLWHSPMWSSVGVLLFTGLTCVSMLKYAMAFLETKDRSPRTHKLITVLVALWLLLTASIPIADYRWVSKLQMILLLPTCATLFFAGILIWIKGYRSARLYVSAWSVFLVTGFATAMLRLGSLPSNWLTENGYNFGFVGWMLLMAMALADRINILRDERQEAQAEAVRMSQEKERLALEQGAVLEKQVAERTAVLADTNSKLEEEVSERKQAETRLAVALESAERLRDEAQAANRTKSEFLANMSHELRTPLNAILGFAQLMGRDPGATSVQRENLEIIGRSGEHLLDLINDVLTMARIEAGRIELDAAPFDLYATLQGIDSMMRLNAGAKDLLLQITIDEDVPRYVKTDQAKLRQTLVNLVGNAIKFTERGGVVLRVRCGPPQKDDSSGAVLSFEVEDTGAGIAESDLESIFDPFVQTMSGRSSQEGTGLGLPISRQFVRLIGGEISVTSEVGKGSTFFFHIDIEPATAEDLSTEDRFRKVIGLASGQPEFRILLVEDNPQNRALLVNLLKPLGFQIREAVNGREGIEISEEWGPDLIFMDMRMPVMDGFEATRRIKNGPKGKQTKIVAVTASVFEHEKELVMEAGCDHFIRKPIRSEEILEALVRHLGVKFRYAESADKVNEQPRKLSDEDVRARLRAMSAEWVSRLNEVAMAGDFEETEALLEEIRGQDSLLADTLVHLMKNYQLDKIVDYTA